MKIFFDRKIGFEKLIVTIPKLLLNFLSIFSIYSVIWILSFVFQYSLFQQYLNFIPNFSEGDFEWSINSVVSKLIKKLILGPLKFQYKIRRLKNRHQLSKVKIFSIIMTI